MAPLLDGFVLYFATTLAVSGLSKMWLPGATADSLRAAFKRPAVPNAVARILGAAELALAIVIVTRWGGRLAAILLVLVAAAFLSYLIRAKAVKAGCGCNAKKRAPASAVDVARGTLILMLSAAAAGHSLITATSHLFTARSVVAAVAYLVVINAASLLVMTALRAGLSSRRKPANVRSGVDRAILRLQPLAEEFHERVATQGTLDRVRESVTDTMDAWKPVLDQYADRQRLQTINHPRRSVLAGSAALLALPFMTPNRAGAVGTLQGATETLPTLETYPPAETTGVWRDYMSAELSGLIARYVADDRVDTFMQAAGVQLKWAKAAGGKLVLHDPRWSASLPQPELECLTVPSALGNGRLVLFLENVGTEPIYVVTTPQQTFTVGGSYAQAGPTGCDTNDTFECIQALLEAAGAAGGLVSTCTACLTGVGVVVCLACAAGLINYAGLYQDLVNQCGECAVEDPNAEALQQQSACVAGNVAFSYTMPCCLNRGGPCTTRSGCPAGVCQCSNGCPTSVSGNACMTYFAPDGTFCACRCCCFTKPGVIGP